MLIIQKMKRKKENMKMFVLYNLKLQFKYVYYSFFYSLLTFIKFQMSCKYHLV